MRRDEWVRAFQGLAGVALTEGESELILELVTTVETAAEVDGGQELFQSGQRSFVDSRLARAWHPSVY